MIRVWGKLDAEQEKIGSLRLCRWCDWCLPPWIPAAVMPSEFLMVSKLQKQACWLIGVTLRGCELGVKGAPSCDPGGK
ncbi:hypothetical protein Y032_0005g2665 [Ancylostoma ceylanicum]|uniref:Uncharacterized protein n=1 Tax=Ancylostoma ceylanicum TaxID=53326 RepID=A0A016VSC9_9BILA|nr:hypothetical protein Y032_0005g2665 [Ancylostoma ceylanicum]